MMSRPSGTLPLRRRLAGCLLALLVVSTVPVGGETELVLIDGRVLSGREVRREGDEYVLTLESGDEISLPTQLVESVRLIGKKEEPEQPDEDEFMQTHPGLRTAGPEALGGVSPPPGPSGLRSEGPQQLAGDPVSRPSRSEQLEVFGEPAEFRKDIVDNSWTPTTDWNMDPETQNNWAPSKWAEDIVDPSWEPESAFDADADVLADSESTWQKGTFDSSWKPTDGFKK
jgi:hypothetical protein